MTESIESNSSSGSDPRSQPSTPSRGAGAPTSVEEVRQVETPPLPARERRRQLRRIFSLLKPYPWRLTAAILSLFIASGLGLLYPQAVRYAIDQGLSPNSLEQLNTIATAAVIIFVLQALFVWIRHFLWSWLGERVVVELRKKVFDRLLLLTPSWFNERRSGELVSRFASDVGTIEEVVGTSLSMALRHGVTLIGAVVLLLAQTPKLSLLMLAIIPPLMLALVAFGRAIRRISKDVQDKLADAGAQLNEAVSNMSTVQAFVRERHEAGRYSDKVESAFDQVRKLVVWRSTFMSSTMLFMFGGIGGILWIGGRAVLNGDMTGGELAAFLMYSGVVAMSVGSLSSVWASLMRAAGATHRIYEIIDTLPDVRDPERPVALPEGGGEVRFEQVDFSYPSRPDEQVLHQVSLHMAPGEVVAVVGPSGSGKSTLAKLLQRFYDPQGGRITFEGTDLRELRIAELRGNMAIVAQEPVLFSGTILENIAYGREGASRDDIEAAARDAHAHSFITEFKDGYDTVVGERGVKLSGGQRQRVAIARAILANPRVLILDEATSSLDAESEALVQEALARLMRGRTTLVIAHRLSTIRDANRIVVIEHGRIAEEGRHDELMARIGGTYRRLVEHQVIAQAV